MNPTFPMPFITKAFIILAMSYPSFAAQCRPALLYKQKEGF